MDTRDLYERALDQTVELVAGVRPDQLSLPTPCTGWDVRTLLTHMAGGNWNSAAVAEGEPPQADRAVDLDGSPADAYRQSAEVAKQAWGKPGRVEGVYEMPMGKLPGQMVLSVRLLETLTHGWDLARATGQTPRYDDDLVEAGMEVAQANLSGERPPGYPFAPAVPVTADLPAIDRLAAFMGRRP
jgi:uncharacterized protein (TIGR03086 family)